MQYCSKCGNQVMGDFCSVCGTRAGTWESSVNQQARIRQDSLDELSKMISYFDHVRNQYEEYKEAVKMAKYHSNPAVGQLRIAPFLVSGIILTVVLGIFSFLPLSITSIKGNNSILESALVIVPFLIPGLGLITAAVIRMIINKHHNKQRLELLDYYSVRAAGYLDGLQLHYNNYEGYRIAFEYCDPAVLQVLCSYITGGRANTITDAINILHLEGHNADMLELAALTAEASARAASYARQAAYR